MMWDDRVLALSCNSADQLISGLDLQMDFKGSRRWDHNIQTFKRGWFTITQLPPMSKYINDLSKLEQSGSEVRRPVDNYWIGDNCRSEVSGSSRAKMSRFLVLPGGKWASPGNVRMKFRPGRSKNWPGSQHLRTGLWQPCCRWNVGAMVKRMIPWNVLTLGTDKGP